MPKELTRPNCARQARNPKRHPIHPLDAVANLPPEQAVETKRNGDNAEYAHRHHPCGDDRHGEQVGDARRRAPSGGSGRPRRAWSRGPRPATR